jgi:hypothetical protein
VGLIVFWLVMAVVTALIANSRGKSAGAWFAYSLLIWPVALVHVLLTPPTRDAVVARAQEQGRRACPHCAEMIMAEAKVCRFCGRDVEPILTAAAEPTETLFGVPLARSVVEAPPPSPPEKPKPLVDPDAAHYLG